MNTGLRGHFACLSTKVPTLRGESPYINFDNAASTPSLSGVLAALQDFMPWYSSVHRGNGFRSRLSTELYEQSRRAISDFVGADPDEHVVIFGKNTTEAINKLSHRLNLTKKDVVLISHLEHHSNDLPWRARATVKRIGLTPTGGIDKADYEALLSKYAGRVTLVAISGASNVTGHLPDIHWFARKAHRAGARIAVDCAQLAAHRPIDMKRLDDPEHLDYVAISGHKMYAPFGSGALIGRRDTFERGDPEYRGGGTVQFVTPQLVDWAEPPDSEEAGSPNVAGAIAMAKATKLLRDIGFDTIAQHEADLTAYALTRLRDIPGLTIYGDTDPAHAKGRSGVIPFTMQQAPSNLVAAILGFEWGIGVRSGCFCAHPYVMTLLALDPLRLRNRILHNRRDLAPGLVRISFGLYNTTAEIDVLAKALTSIAEGRHSAYIADHRTGQYIPVNMKENFSDYFAL